jgi:zinc metalloprotease ZmpA
MNVWLSRLAIVFGLLGSFVMSGAAQGDGSSVDDAAALSASLAYLQTQAQEWGIRDAPSEFRLRQVVRDSLGQSHVRLDQVYQGLQVFGQQVIVHLDQSGTAHSVTGAYRAGINLSTQPVISIQEARTRAQQHAPGAVDTPPQADLVVYPQGDDVRLVYRVVLHDDKTPRRVVAFVDANSGEVVHSYNDLHTLLPSDTPPRLSTRGEVVPSVQEQAPTPTVAATGVGHSLYSGTVNIITDEQNGTFSLIDGSRGGLRTSDMRNLFIGRFFGVFWPGVIFTDADNDWGNASTSDRASAGVDAHFGAEATWDYYLNVHGRSGIFNDGVGTLSRVHYGRRYNNAFWLDECKCMTYGDGDGTLFSPLVPLDVAGHEMTHGVTSATAALIYDNQSGGLNEAISDIFGAMVEFFAVTLGAAKTPNYLIGEDVFTPGTPGDALRYMNNPTQDGNSIDTFADYFDDLDVHFSSGIANNAYFLLAEGGTHRLGGVVTGIGRSDAERIFYRALTVYMIPSETFSQARASTTQAAIDLFGDGSQQAISVGQAWSAVGVQ